LSDKKDFIWKAVRFGFWIFIGLFILVIISAVLGFEFENDIAMRIYLIGFWLIFITLIFNLITSIIHLTKYKDKGIAITSLVISSFFILLGLLAMILLSSISPENDFGKYDAENDLKEYLDFSCENFCIGLENVESYTYNYKENTDPIMCYCLDINGEIINKKPIKTQFF
jgi:hypothetical protein